MKRSRTAVPLTERAMEQLFLLERYIESPIKERRSTGTHFVLFMYDDELEELLLHLEGTCSSIKESRQDAIKKGLLEPLLREDG